MAQKTKRQHYVYKHYLDNWADSKGQVKVFDSKIRKSFVTNTINVCVENGIYDVGPLSDKDVFVFRNLFNEHVSHLLMLDKLSFTSLTDIWEAIMGIRNNLYENDLYRLIDIIVFTGKAKYFFQQSGAEIEECEKLDIENIECVIEEQGFIPFLESMKIKDFSLFFDRPKFFRFLLMLSFQFSRTDKILNQLTGNELIKSSNRALMHLFCVSMQFDLLVNIFYKITVIKNNTDNYFITGDQPFILHRVFDEAGVSELPSFYFPVTPKLAITITGYNGKENQLNEINIDNSEDIDTYNDLIKENCSKLVCIVD